MQWTTREAVWSHLLDCARGKSDGVLLVEGTGAVPIASGGLLVTKTLPISAQARAAVRQGIPEKTVKRAMSMARSARRSLPDMLIELGAADEVKFADVVADAVIEALDTVLASDGPWQWRDGKPEGAPVADVLRALVRHLAQVPAKKLAAWSGNPNKRRFKQPEDDLWVQVDGPMQAWFSAHDGRRELRALLADAPVSAREALAWMTVGIQLGWLPAVGKRAPTVASTPEATATEPAFLDTPDDITEVETADENDAVPEDESPASIPVADVDPIAAPDAEDEPNADAPPLVELDEAPAAQAESQPAEQPTGGGEAEELFDLDAAESKPAADAAPSAPESPSEPSPAEPQPQNTAGQSRKPFYASPPSQDLYARLGIPAGTAGQGVAQAYSKRFRVIKKAVKKHGEDRRLLRWQEALLCAYQILQDEEAAELYDRLASKGVGDPERQTFVQMSEEAFRQGVTALQDGQVYEAGRAFKEAVKWDDRYVDAWAMLGLVQAWMDEPEDTRAALDSFHRAVELSPERADLRYYRAVAAHYAGDTATFEEDRAWLDRDGIEPPEAWSAFKQAAAA